MQYFEWIIDVVPWKALKYFKRLVKMDLTGENSSKGFERQNWNYTRGVFE